MEETARGCSQEGLGRVLLNPGNTGLAAKYGLKLVAGTFVRVPWSGKSTEQDLCRNRCQDMGYFQNIFQNIFSVDVLVSPSPQVSPSPESMICPSVSPGLM